MRKASGEIPEYADFPMPPPEAIRMYRVTPVVISVLDYTLGFGHTDLVTYRARNIGRGRASVPTRLDAAPHGNLYRRNVQTASSCADHRNWSIGPLPEAGIRPAAAMRRHAPARGIAADIDHNGHVRRDDLRDLLRRTGVRRIEHDRGEPGKLLRRDSAGGTGRAGRSRSGPRTCLIGRPPATRPPRRRPLPRRHPSMPWPGEK